MLVYSKKFQLGQLKQLMSQFFKVMNTKRLITFIEEMSAITSHFEGKSGSKYKQTEL
jgi:hypothetical protein